MPRIFGKVGFCRRFALAHHVEQLADQTERTRVVLLSDDRRRHRGWRSLAHLLVPGVPASRRCWSPHA